MVAIGERPALAPSDRIVSRRKVVARFTGGGGFKARTPRAVYPAARL